MSVYFMPLETVMINVVEKVEKREHLYNVGGNINCYSHCGKKIKNKTTMLSSNALLNIYSKEKNHNQHLKEISSLIFHHSIIHDTQSRETTK